MDFEVYERPEDEEVDEDAMDVDENRENRDPNAMDVDESRVVIKQER